MTDTATNEEQSPAGVGTLSSAIIQAVRLHRFLATRLLREVGLHLGQELVLMRLWEGGPQRQSEIVRTTGSDTATMTRTIQRLERGGFVRRTPDPTDGRAVIVETTPAGDAIRRQVEAIWARLESATVGDLDDNERHEAIRLLGEIEANLERALGRS